MAKILITGAHGFIGKHLARDLASKGHFVSGLGHGIWPPIEASSWGIQDWLNGDVHSANLRTLQARSQPELIFHLAGGSSVGAAIANPREDFFRTVASTVELLEWMRVDLPHARLIAVSSAAVYGSGFSGPIPEEIESMPYSPYGHHKKMMEQLCRSYSDTYGIDCRVARLFSVYGPQLKKQLLWDICTRLASSSDPLVLGGSGDELRDWTSVDDVARALALIATQTDRPLPHQAVNIGTGVGTPVKDIAHAVISAWQKRHAASPRPQLQFSGKSRPGDPLSLIADPTRLIAMGFEWGTPLASGIDSFVEWFTQFTRQ